ncbi:MAG: uroporphyrinogen-III synthase [Acidobacteria bacterium]|nr:uroporphyrinogen-III synthase [Acidobacteriota bacterium]
MLVVGMAGLNGLRVLSFESRRAKEIAQLIAHNGGVPIVAPATREVTTSPNPDELELIRGILNQHIHAIIFMTGVGARALVDIAERIGPRQQFLSALAHTRVVVRGPKPAAAMRELGVPITLNVPEPNTWREIIAALDRNPNAVPLAGCRIAVQEHGTPSLELYEELRHRGAQVFPVHVYHWELPEDTGPLKHAIGALVRDEVDIVMFTSRVQFIHAEKVAEEMGVGEQFKRALNRAAVASIGPVASETLRQDGIRVDFEPSHPKMGYLVKEVAENLAELLKARPNQQTRGS